VPVRALSRWYVGHSVSAAGEAVADAAALGEALAVTVAGEAQPDTTIARSASAAIGLTVRSSSRRPEGKLVSGRQMHVRGLDADPGR
jgi:hypothetical protein